MASSNLSSAKYCWFRDIGGPVSWPDAHVGRSYKPSISRSKSIQHCRKNLRKTGRLWEPPAEYKSIFALTLSNNSKDSPLSVYPSDRTVKSHAFLEQSKPMLALSMSLLINCHRKSWNIMLRSSSFLPTTCKRRYSLSALRIEIASKARISQPLRCYSTLRKLWKESNNLLANSMHILCPLFLLYNMPTSLLSLMCLSSAPIKTFPNSIQQNLAAWRSFEAWQARRSHPFMCQSQFNLSFRRSSW